MKVAVRIIAVVAAILGCLFLTSIAQAEIRTLNMDDPEGDITPTLSGVPDLLDIKNVRVRLDLGDGSFSIRTELYRSPEDIDTSKNYAFSGSFGFGQASYGECFPLADVTGQHHWYSTRGNQFLDIAEMRGYSGNVPLKRTMSDRDRVATVTGKVAPMTGRDFRCFDYLISVRTYSTIENIHSQYDAVCGCWYSTNWSDFLGPPWAADRFVFFDGLGPSKARKVDSKIRFQVRTKRRMLFVRPLVTPRRTSQGKKSFTGKVRLKIHRGPRVVEKRLVRPNKWARFWWLAPGRYAVSGNYLGDTWRRKSLNFGAKHFRVAPRRWWR